MVVVATCHTTAGCEALVVGACEAWSVVAVGIRQTVAAARAPALAHTIAAYGAGALLLAVGIDRAGGTAAKASRACV